MQTTTITIAENRSHTSEANPLIKKLLYKNNTIYPDFANTGSRRTIVSRTAARFTRSFSRLTRFMKDYRYYRGKGFNSKSAWYLAGMTLP